MMWIADQWKDYELLDCGDGEKLERWNKQILVRPDPQAIWEAPRRNSAWNHPDARYLRSNTGGGHWERKKLPEQWQVRYRELTFNVKPMNFKHTGLFPEQAVNWDFAMDMIRRACLSHPRAEPVCLHRGGHHCLRSRRSQCLPCGRSQRYGFLGPGQCALFASGGRAHPLDRG